MGNWIYGGKCEKDWSYSDDDDCGPSHWEIRGHFKQSPILIDPSTVEIISIQDQLVFVNYDQILKGTLSNNGHTVEFIPDPEGPHLEIYGGGLGQRYRLKQYHFHWGDQDQDGSEHKIRDLQYPAELHLVHQGIEDPKKVAVIGIFLKIGEKGMALADEEQSLHSLREPGSKVSLEHLSIGQKLPKNRDTFWRYEGSLTTPPCSEIVTWTLFTEPIDVTKEQLDLLRNLKDHRQKPLKTNHRPVQGLYDRTVYQYWPTNS